MKKIIIIRGPICAGKSAVVEILRKKIKDVSVIDFDAFKRLIDNKKSSQWRRILALSTALYLGGKLMKKRRTIIADIHASKMNQLNCFRKLSRQNNYILYTFLIWAPLEVCLARNKSRKVPDISYKITQKMIKEYWQDTIKIKNEIIFDSSQLSAEYIAKEINNIVKIEV